MAEEILLWNEDEGQGLPSLGGYYGDMPNTGARMTHLLPAEQAG